MLFTWEGEEHFVFFDERSGDTHLLSAFALLMAEVIGQDCLSHADILRKLLDNLDPELSAEVDVVELLEVHIPGLTEVGFLLEQTA